MSDLVGAGILLGLFGSGMLQWWLIKKAIGVVVTLVEKIE